MSQLSLIGAGVVTAVLVAWFLVANQRWARHIRGREPELGIDPVAHPANWTRTAPARLRRQLVLLKSPSDVPSVELARQQTLKRLFVAGALAPVALLGLPAAARSIVLFSTTEMERGALIGGVFVVLLLAILSYRTYRLALAAIRFGNSEPISPPEFAVSMFGIVVTLVGAVFIASTPVG